jgi:hypothetical protein
VKLTRYAILLSRLGEDFFGRIDAACGYVLTALTDGFFDAGFSGEVEETLVVFCELGDVEGFEGGAGGVLAGGGELGGEGVRDFEGHLHGIRVAPAGGVDAEIFGGFGEGKSVATLRFTPAFGRAEAPAAGWLGVWAEARTCRVLLVFEVVVG